MIIDPLRHCLVALKKTIPAVLLLGLFSLAGVNRTSGQITIDFVYDGADTTVNYSMAPSTFVNWDVKISGSHVEDRRLVNGGLYNVSAGSYEAYGDDVGGINPVWGSSNSADSFSGVEVIFEYTNGFIYVPLGYDLSTGLSGSMTWNNTDLVALGFAANTDASGSFVLVGVPTNWSTSAPASAVPEPSTYAAFVGMVALICCLVRRRVNRRGQSFNLAV